MSFFVRILQRIRSPSRYVGRDLEGNRFYEHPSSTADLRRTKRTVEYSDPEVVWDYVGGAKRLPVQWSAWLTHTRSNAPTLEELQADMTRQRRVLANVALIEAREREEQAQTPRLNAASPKNVGHHTSNSQVEGGLWNEAPMIPNTDQPPSLDAQRDEPTKAPKMGSNPSEPESWNPRARGRGGNN